MGSVWKGGEGEGRRVREGPFASVFVECVASVLLRFVQMLRFFCA